MEVEVHPSRAVPRGHIRLPGSMETGPVTQVRLGSVVAPVAVEEGSNAPNGQLLLAPDLWRALSIPLEGLRLQAKTGGNGELELGPALAVLYPGKGPLPAGEVLERLGFYFGHRRTMAGLLAIAFDQQIDWSGQRMRGYVLDNRPGVRERVAESWFPMPGVVRLTWSIDREVIRRLREQTGNRVFNWVRNIGKWEMYTIFSANPSVAPHLPETRLLRGPVQVAALLARHGTVFVKNVFGIQGKQMARIRRRANGLEVSRMGERQMESTLCTDLVEAVELARTAAGQGRKVVQQGIDITGTEGRALDFRVLLARDRDRGWRSLGIFGKVAPDSALAFTNFMNGAEDVPGLEALILHHGMEPREAAAVVQEMIQLCQRAADSLAERFDPVGLLGFDVAVEAGSHRLWLFEANSVPGWGYDPAFDQRLARSQAEYGLFLTGFPLGEDHQP